MKLGKTWLIAACFLVAGQAFADETNVNVDNTGRSEAQTQGQDDNYHVGVTNFAIRPEAGAIFFQGQQRFTGGVLMDFNVLNTPWAKIGPSIGALYSSVGGGGDFFSGVSTSNNDYIFQLPGNLKVTFAPDPSGRLQLGAHGGANIIRSSSGVGVFGGPGQRLNLASGGGASWDVRPNVGGDIDFALGTNADLTLRPDVTFFDGFNLVTTTIGLGLKL